MVKMVLAAVAACFFFTAEAVPPFDSHFNDSTLRLDYVFGGGPDGARVFLDRMSKSRGWHGKRTRLADEPLEGNGEVTVTDAASGDTIYRKTFSSLFQEWVNTPEALSESRSFENTFIMPLPKREADVTVVVRDNRHGVAARSSARYRPSDELVAILPESTLLRRYVHRGGDPAGAIDIAMIAEGYTEDEAEAFFADAGRMADEILSYEPFASRRERFNFIAVMPPSRESGVSIPLEGIWKDTALGAHYSTFHSARYLTSPHVHRMHDFLTGIPYEHVMILANTDRYGGGGIFNSYQMATTRNEHSLPVTVHEFGHSFGGLADEYFYPEKEDSTYPLDVEPWEPNITTLVDFDSKWCGMMDEGTPVPTPGEDKSVVGVFEGGGYRSKGVYRPAFTCRMRDNYHPAFCPVCEAALARVIDFYTLP